MVAASSECAAEIVRGQQHSCAYTERVGKRATRPLPNEEEDESDPERQPHADAQAVAGVAEAQAVAGVAEESSRGDFDERRKMEA